MLKKILNWQKNRKAELAEFDRLWREDQNQYNFELPKSYWFLRLPIVRRIRFIYFGIRLHLWARMWNSAGIGFGGLISQYDEWVLYAISRGWC